MNISRVTTISLILAVAVLALGYANPSLAAPSCIKNPDHPKCEPDTTSDDTTSGGKHPSLILTFFDQTNDNIQSIIPIDGMASYVDKEGAAVSAGGQTQPNAAGIAFQPKHKAKNPRFVYLDIECVDIRDVASCDDFPQRLKAYFAEWQPEKTGIKGQFARCPEKNNCGGVRLALRPYEVNCPDPDPDDGTCPSIYTMSPDATEEMSYRVGFSSGLLIEIASNIGGASSPNPGRCLSLMEENARKDFIKDCEDEVFKCNVTVEAFDDGFFMTEAGADDGENDSWIVTADHATALICDRQSGTVLGTATMSFRFDAIKKD